MTDAVYPERHEPQVHGPRFHCGRETHIVGVVYSAFCRKARLSGVDDPLAVCLGNRQPVDRRAFGRVEDLRAYCRQATGRVDPRNR